MKIDLKTIAAGILLVAVVLVGSIGVNPHQANASVSVSYLIVGAGGQGGVSGGYTGGGGGGGEVKEGTASITSGTPYTIVVGATSGLPSSAFLITSNGGNQGGGPAGPAGGGSSGNGHPGGSGSAFNGGGGGGDSCNGQNAGGGGGGGAGGCGTTATLDGATYGQGGDGTNSGSPGSANTGRGGSSSNASGGSGIVKIRAPLGTIASATGGTHTSDATYDYWTFTSSGTWTPTFGGTTSSGATMLMSSSF